MIKLFFTYNDNSDLERATTLRTQIISALYGVTVYLPNRFKAKKLKSSTKERIADSDLLVIFNTRNLSKRVLEEISYAKKLKKKILMFYIVKTKVIENMLSKNKNIIEVYFNPLNTSVIDILKEKKIEKLFCKKNSLLRNTGITIITLGLCLFVLGVIKKR